MSNILEKLKEILTDRRLYILLGSLVTFGIVMALVLDFLIMPSYTNYNEGITVPDVTQISLDEASTLLNNYGLRHEVLDRRSHSAYPADYIIDQSPSPQQIVKPNRKIYLTVNTAITPQTVVPDVVNMSLRNAEIQLENHGLEVGTKSYESSRFRNTILRQSVAAGDSVARGTVVNLAVSDGLGSRIVEVPDIVGMRLSEAQQNIMKAGLRVGEVRFQPNREYTPNTVISFSPDKEELNEGESLQLIVAERFDAREESESGAIIDDSTSVNQENQNPSNNE